MVIFMNNKQFFFVGLFFLIFLLCVCAAFYKRWHLKVQRDERIKNYGKLMIIGQAHIAKKLAAFPLLFKKKITEKNVEENIEDDEGNEKKDVNEVLIVRESEMVMLNQKERLNG